ncbi:hypothetical protein evm_003421 [Chilo suppressalis]|nr:hypothetical protein evm_003421 [Chilo suppressalis]
MLEVKKLLREMPSLNPARALGPAFVLSRWEGHWVSWVGGLGGGCCSALLHEWGSRRPPALSRASSPRDLDELDKPFHYRHAPSYCAAAAPRPDTSEPLYSGTKSLYCRSPPPTRHTLHRSQSVYSKGSSATGAPGGSLVAAQSLLLRPHAIAHNAHAAHNAHSAHNGHPAHAHNAHTVHNAHNQNAHNAQREPTYGTTPNGVRPGPTGAAVTERRESVYSAGGSSSGQTASVARRGPLASDDSAYGSAYRAYRPHPHPHTPPEHY